MRHRSLPRVRPSSEKVNRRTWNRQSAEYDRRHRAALSRQGGQTWGLWRIPERTLGLMGVVRQKDVLEVGCGAGRWSFGLARRGARPVGLDFSKAQLSIARRLQRGRARRVPLVLGTAEALPFGPARFDLVFCDWGALTFADPRRSIPEAARVLRRGGRLVFATSSPFRAVAQHRRGDRMSRRLLFPYFGLHRLDYGNEVNYLLPYGEWIDLFGACGLQVERLVETPTPTRPHTTYAGPAERAWGRKWPLESIWLLRKIR